MAIAEPGAIDGRVVGMLVGPAVRATHVEKVGQALAAEGAVLQVIGPRGGFIGDVEIHHTLHTCDSVQFDALVVDPSASALVDEALKASVIVQEVYRHHKPLAAIGTGADLFAAAGVDSDAPGVLVDTSSAKRFQKALVESIGWHRHWERVV
jgi:catalase